MTTHSQSDMKAKWMYPIQKNVLSRPGRHQEVINNDDNDEKKHSIDNSRISNLVFWLKAGDKHKWREE